MHFTQFVFSLGSRALGCTWAAAVLVLALIANTHAQTPPSGYNLTRLGLTGSLYESTSSSGTAYLSFASQMNQAGQVRGTTYLGGHTGGGLGRDAWFFDGTTTQQIGLVGSSYDWLLNGTTARMVFTERMNEAGQVLGYSQRRTNTGVQIGRDYWFFDGTSTQPIGLTGLGYEYTHSSGGTYRQSLLLNIEQQMNQAGYVTGYTQRYTASGSGNGQDVWLFDGTTTKLIALTGPGYESVNASTGELYRYSEVKQINEAGQVIGSASRRTGTGSGLGTDAWFFNGTTTQAIGLTGAGYQYTNATGTTRTSYAYYLNDAGQASGYTRRMYGSSYYSDSQDAWFFNGTGTQLISLTGTGYEYALNGNGLPVRHAYPEQINKAGHVRGYNDRYNASGNGLGRETWFFNGTTTQVIGLSGDGYERPTTSSGGGMVRDNYTQQMNEAGQVLGSTDRYNTSREQLGQDIWQFNGTTTQRIGLSGPGYEYTFTGTGGGTYRYTAASEMNEAGQVLGVSQRYSTAGDFLGRDAWLYNGTATQLIGLTGSTYESTYPGGGIYRNNVIQQLNEAGQVMGYSERANSLGQAGWFFDPTTNTTTALEFSFLPDNYSFTTPVLLTEAGVVLGTYRLYNSNGLVGDRAFWWSLEAGFYDLGGLVEGGLTAEGWKHLSTVYASTIPGEIGATPDGSPLYILGTGQVTGQYTGTSVYLLTPVPEPSTMILVGLGVAFGGLRLMRRRRSGDRPTRPARR